MVLRLVLSMDFLWWVFLSFLPQLAIFIVVLLAGSSGTQRERLRTYCTYCFQVQGTFGWKTVTSLFTKEEEHGTDGRVEQEPEITTEETPASCTSDNHPQKSSSALWNVFTSRWQQNTVQRSEARGVLAEPPEERNEAQHVEETPFKWSFLTKKLEELRSKNE
ncbi:unnamed protein product [Ranitomeya imitator]|uniref:Uncharacterized protein n=1 Tax=Ranitomeya imitator TaxID=111125 RepID=A0ABN9MMX6_9NEOB|nr:unnamed protein product [Ranitomeya imitator]